MCDQDFRFLEIQKSRLRGFFLRVDLNPSKKKSTRF